MLPQQITTTQKNRQKAVYMSLLNVKNLTESCPLIIRNLYLHMLLSATQFAFNAAFLDYRICEPRREG